MTRPPYWELRLSGGHSCRRDDHGRMIARDSEIVLGRKFCSLCGRWRYLIDFARTTQNASGAYSYCGPCDRRRKRDAAKRRTDPQRELDREYQRIWREGQRREAGVKPRTFYNRETAVDRIESVYLDPGPLVAELRRQDVEIRPLSRRTGIPERSIDRILRGESRHVRLDLADKLAVALGYPLTLLYGVDPPVIVGRPPNRKPEEIAA